MTAYLSPVHEVRPAVVRGPSGLHGKAEGGIAPLGRGRGGAGTALCWKELQRPGRVQSATLGGVERQEPGRGWGPAVGSPAELGHSKLNGQGLRR